MSRLQKTKMSPFFGICVTESSRRVIFVICTVFDFTLDAAWGHNHDVDPPLVGKLLASGAAKSLAGPAAFAFTGHLLWEVQAVSSLRRGANVESHFRDDEFRFFKTTSFMGVAFD